MYFFNRKRQNSFFTNKTLYFVLSVRQHPKNEKAYAYIASEYAEGIDGNHCIKCMSGSSWMHTVLYSTCSVGIRGCLGIVVALVS